LANVGINGTLT